METKRLLTSLASLIVKASSKDMYEDLAHLLLTDAFVSAVEDSESASNDKLYEMLRSQGQELTGALDGLAEDLGVKLEPFYPLQMVKDIEAEADKKWKGAMTLEELYDMDEGAASSLMLYALGAGVSPWDDHDEETIPKIELGYYESPYENALNLIDAMRGKMDEHYREMLASDDMDDLDEVYEESHNPEIKQQALDKINKLQGLEMSQDDPELVDLERALKKASK